MIDYLKLSEAVKHYKQAGFKEIELPWTAALDTIKITLPENARPVTSLFGPLIGSAEQAFLDAVINSKLKGKFQATTPCFRDDPEDDLHQPYFMKTELFYNQEQDADTLKKELFKALEHAQEFFKRYLEVEVLQTGGYEYDIVGAASKIELGSYGIRNHPMVGSWVYATGCAEPRLSKVIAYEACSKAKKGG